MNKVLVSIVNKDLNYGREVIDSFAKQYTKKDSIVALDIGAGRGADLLLLQKNLPNSDLNAIENYPPNVEHLKSNNIKAFPLNVENEKLPFENSSVDIIICNQLLEHCKEIFWIMHEVSRVLKEGGELWLGVPNLASLHNRLLLLLGRHPTSIKNNSAHVRGFTKDDVLKTLSGNSRNLYILKEFKGSNFYPFPGPVARILAKIFPSMSVGIFFRLQKQGNYSREFLDYPIQQQLETNFFLGKR